MKKLYFLNAMVFALLLLTSAPKVAFAASLSGKVLDSTQWIMEASDCNNELEVTYELTLNINGTAMEARGTWSHERRDGTIWASGTYNSKDASFELGSRGWTFKGKFFAGEDGTEAKGEMFDNPVGCTEFTVEQNTEEKKDYFVASRNFEKKEIARQLRNIEEIKRKAVEEAKRQWIAEMKVKAAADAKRQAAADAKRQAAADAKRQAAADRPKRELSLKYGSSPAIDKDPEALTYFTRAVNNFKRGQCGLALNYLGKLSKKGHTRSLNALGVFIKDGHCLDAINTPNGRILKGGKPQAIKYFRKAISQGSSRALLNLGEMYEEGDGVNKDTEVAVYLYGLAEKRGFEAQKKEAGDRIKNIKAQIAAEIKRKAAAEARRKAEIAAEIKRKAAKEKRYVRLLEDGKAAFDAGKYSKALAALTALPEGKLDGTGNLFLGKLHARKNSLTYIDKSIARFRKAASAGSKKAEQALKKVKARKRQIQDMRKAGYLEIRNKVSCFAHVGKNKEVLNAIWATWDGSCENKRVNGEGTLVWVFKKTGKKDIYVGGYKEGKRHGKATYTWKSGDKYVGGWKEGKQHGQGTITWKSGSKYVGGFQDDEKHGQGTFTWKSGDKYVGGYKEGKQHGQGVYTCGPNSLNPATYKGTWENDKKTGTPIRCSDYEAVNEYADVAISIYSLIRGADSCEEAGLLSESELSELEKIAKDNFSILMKTPEWNSPKWKGRFTKRVIKAGKTKAWEAAVKTQMYYTLHYSALAVVAGKDPKWMGVKNCRLAKETMLDLRRLFKRSLKKAKNKKSGPRL